MLLSFSISIYLLILHEGKALQMKAQMYIQREGKQMTGEAMETSKVDAASQCSMVCLANSCKAYNVITSDNNLLCEVFPEEKESALTDNQDSVYYGKLVNVNEVIGRSTQVLYKGFPLFIYFLSRSPLPSAYRHSKNNCIRSWKI